MISVTDLITATEYTTLKYSSIEKLYNDFFSYNEAFANSVLSLFVDLDSSKEDYELKLKALYTLCIKNDAGELDYNIICDLFDKYSVTTETLIYVLSEYDSLVYDIRKNAYLESYTKDEIIHNGSLVASNLMHFVNENSTILPEKTYDVIPYNLILKPELVLVRKSKEDGFRNYHEVKSAIQDAIEEKKIIVPTVISIINSRYKKLEIYLQNIAQRAFRNLLFVSEPAVKSQFSVNTFENSNYKNIFSHKEINGTSVNVDARVKYSSIIKAINNFIDYQIENNMSSDIYELKNNMEKYYDKLLDIDTDSDYYYNIENIISIAFLLDNLFGTNEATSLNEAYEKATIIFANIDEIQTEINMNKAVELIASKVTGLRTEEVY